MSSTSSIIVGAFGALMVAFCIAVFYGLLNEALAKLWKHPSGRGSLTRIVEQSIAGVLSALIALVVVQLLGL
jgi:hypothetical protein